MLTRLKRDVLNKPARWIQHNTQYGRFSARRVFTINNLKKATKRASAAVITTGTVSVHGTVTLDNNPILLRCPSARSVTQETICPTMWLTMCPTLEFQRLQKGGREGPRLTTRTTARWLHFQRPQPCWRFNFLLFRESPVFQLAVHLLLCNSYRVKNLRRSRELTNEDSHSQNITSDEKQFTTFFSEHTFETKLATRWIITSLSTFCYLQWNLQSKVNFVNFNWYQQLFVQQWTNFITHISNAPHITFTENI